MKISLLYNTVVIYTIHIYKVLNILLIDSTVHPTYLSTFNEDMYGGVCCILNSNMLSSPPCFPAFC